MSALSDTVHALDLPSQPLPRLTAFAALFLKWNASINLSAARSTTDVEDHIVDCLQLVPHLCALLAARPRADPARFLDVGAGGGLPSVIVAICLPDTQVVALEPVHKKHAFLRTAARELALPNFEPRAERLEQHPPRHYAAAMSRATFDLRDWLLLGAQHLEIDGRVFGFEAVPRDDLPAETVRSPYRYRGTQRAIVSRSRPGAPDDVLPVDAG